jgi:hypothetical protein
MHMASVRFAAFVAVVAALAVAPAHAWERRIAATFQVDLLHVDARGDIYAAVRLDPALSDGETTGLMKLGGRTGAERWRAVVPSAGARVNRSAVVTAIGTQPSGDVVVVATATNGRSHDVIRFARHEARTGEVRWRRTVRGDTASGHAAAFGATIDHAGDVVAAGTITRGPVQGRSDAEDVLVVKLSGETGVERWRHQLDLGANRYDGANSVAVDSRNDVLVVAGGTTGPASGVAFVAKHASDTGEVVWRTPLSTGGRVVGVTHDDDAILAGIGAVTRVRGGSGEIAWSAQFPAIGNVFDARELPSGDIVAFGIPSYTSKELMIVRLDGATGVEAWRTVVDDAFTLGFNQLLTIAGDRILVGGQRTPLTETCYDAFTTVVDGSGAVIASHVFDGTTVARGCESECGEGPNGCTPGYGTDRDEAFAVAVRPDGQMIVAGALNDGRRGRPRGFVATTP